MTAQNAIQCALGYYQAGQLAQAEAICRQILDATPDHVDAMHLYGMIAGQNGKNEIAAEWISKAISLAPSCAMYYNLGSVLHNLARLDDAIESYQKALVLKPDLVEAHCNLGLVLTEQGRLDEAIESCRRALALRPAFAEAYNNLGNALKEQGKLDAANACYCQALKLKPSLAEVHSNQGNAFQDQGRFEEAIESFHRALTLNPNDVEAHIGMGRVCQDTGQFDVARTHLERALALKPDHPVAWGEVPFLQKMTTNDRAWAETAQHLLNGRVKPQEEMRLCYALGKYNDDIRQPEAAFFYYERANKLRRHLLGTFDRESFQLFVDAIISTHTPQTTRLQQAGGSESCRPLFIVGMPRSGTSLTEQILASHPDIFGAGELSFWRQQADKYLSAVPALYHNTPLLQDVAAQYEAELQRHSATALRVVDKMPGNFLYLGLIHTVFPKARILHTQRSPIDTCLSIYFQRFTGQHTYANDLEDLAFYYREYHRLMAHWRVVLPHEQFMDVPYEALVDDQEGWSRKLIEFVGLEWDARCLSFHETERKVGTASNWQVRQPIYKSSVARWRAYEKFLGPLFDGLGEFAPER